MMKQLLLVFSFAASMMAWAGTPVVLPACPASPNCVSSQSALDDSQHYIKPFVLQLPAVEAWPRLRQVVAAQVRTEVVEEKTSPAYLRAEATSRIFRFVDDLELWLDADGKTVHVRSASRTGYGDLGVNRKRVEGLREQLQQQGIIAAP